MMEFYTLDMHMAEMFSILYTVNTLYIHCKS
jgi:hypothetical protein